ncbi:acyltransferase family protein [Streptosporangium carneum]|uniref:acyltransferase family protein n=1 Tax=Streptosporangium carneum TaxID=47481 RepID=UPI0031E831DC
MGGPYADDRPFSSPGTGTPYGDDRWPSSASGTGAPYADSPASPAPRADTPYPGPSFPNAFGSPDERQVDAHRPATRETRPPYQDMRGPGSGGFPGTASGPVPGGVPKDPLDPAWSPAPQERGAGQGWSQEHEAARAQAWTPATPAAPPSEPRPAEPRDVPERPFSYWENPSRETWESAEREAAPPVSPHDHAPWAASPPADDRARHAAPSAPGDHSRHAAPAPPDGVARHTAPAPLDDRARHAAPSPLDGPARQAPPEDPALRTPDDHALRTAPSLPDTRARQAAPPPFGEHVPSQWGRPQETEREPGPRPEEEPSAPPARRKREPYLDNVKFVLIALVVTGHSLVPTLAAHSAKSAYLFIYTFHMPAFVLLSGYLGRNFWNSNAKINKLVDTMLVPYAFVEIGYALLRYALGQKWTLTIIDPAWLNWYLVALVLWRISTPIWTRMRQPLLVAVTIYMLAGFSEISGDFSLDRFFGLLPFYVCGLLLKPEHFDLLKPLWVRIAAGVVVVAAVATAVYIAPRVGLDPVYYRYSFKSMDTTWWMGLIVRAGMLVAGLVLSVALLALVPRRETWFSDLGTRTLYAYLLHGVVVLIAKELGWLSYPWLYGPLGVLAIASSALVLAIVLCLPQTRTLFKWLLEPRLVWLYRRPAEAVPDRPAEATPDRESSIAVPR